jgi:hypothetical protein
MGPQLQAQGRRGTTALAWGCLLSCLQLGCLQLDTGGGDGATAQQTAQNQPAPGAAAGAAGGSSMPPLVVPAGAQRGFVLEGSYAYGLEGSVFLQCGSQEAWWVSFEGLALERFDEASLGLECDPSCLFVVKGTGDLSPRGRYGQAGNYPRELTVTRVSRLERVTQAPNLFTLNDLNCPR